MSEEHGSPQAEPGIGRRLEQARETRGLSLRRVEEITKIRARYLRELERENFDVLPTVYVLGSLKTYADFLGLDGTALSRELKESLEPDESKAAVAADPGEADDEHEATPAVSIGFDHLFVGMGVVIVSVLALMTLVSAVARYEEPKVSQMNEPSVQDVPPEMALTGNVDPEPPDPEPRTQSAGEIGKEKEQTKPDQQDRPEPPKPEPPEEDGEEGKPEEDEQPEEEEPPEEASSPMSLFDNVEFAPISPSSPQGTASASASASAPASSMPPASTPPASTPPASTPPASISPSPAPSAYTSPSPAPAASASATPDPPPPDTTSSSVAASPPAATDRPGDAFAAPAPASVRPARPAVPRGGGMSPGSGSVFSPGDAADAGRIQAGVDATLERAIPGR